MKFAALLLFVLATPAAAQDYVVRDGDILAVDLEETIFDRDIEYYDGGVSRYGADGSYSWTYALNNGGGVWPGTFTVSDDATVCITFESGAQRCDMFVMAQSGLVLLTDDGQRYPVRDIR